MPWQDDPITQPSERTGSWRDDPVVAAANPAQQPQRSFGQQVGRQLGRTARIAAEGVAALPLAAMDAGVAGRNLITGSKYELPSQMFQGALDATGLPRAEGGVEKAVDLVGQVAVGSRAPVPGVRNPAPVARPVAPPNAAQQVIQQGEQHGVPVFFDDVTKSAVAKRVGVAAESLGEFGTGGGRARQATAASAAATRVTQNLAPSAGDDVPELVQAGLRNQLATFRQTANRLYTRASEELDPIGSVPRAQFERVIADEVAAQGKLGTIANADIVTLLQKYAAAPTGNFTLARNLRSQLNDEISDFYTGKNATIGAKGVTALRAMQEALEADMASFAQRAGGKGNSAWRTADGFYRTNVVPFKEAGFRDLVKTAEPEKAWRYLIAQGSLKSRSLRMYRSLDEQGRSAVRYGLVKDALDNATNPQGTFSPARFAKYLEDHDNAVNTFFKGSELQEIKGFQNLMRHVERAGQFAENPPTGQRLIPFLLGGAAFVEPATAGTIAGVGVTVGRLFQSNTGRNLLLAMSRSKVGSSSADRLTNRIGRILAASAAVGRTAAQDPTGETETTQSPEQ